MCLTKVDDKLDFRDAAREKPFANIMSNKLEHFSKALNHAVIKPAKYDTAHARPLPSSKKIKQSSRHRHASVSSADAFLNAFQSSLS
jgi:hypothetical protein